MANPLDASGRAAERIALGAKLTAIASQISAWTGDQNGLRDLQMKAADISYRLNSCSTVSGTGKSNYDTAFGYSGFSLEQVST